MDNFSGIPEDFPYEEVHTTCLAGDSLTPNPSKHTGMNLIKTGIKDGLTPTPSASVTPQNPAPQPPPAQE